MLFSPSLQLPFSHDIPKSGLAIPAGRTAQLGFVFQPLEQGEIPAQLIIPLNIVDTHVETRTVRLVGSGRRASLDCEPAALDFGVVLLATTRSLQVVCTNPLEFAVEVHGATFLGEHARSFEARLDGANDRLMLGPGESVRADVSFRSASLGLNEAALELKSGADEVLAEIPVQADVVYTTVSVEPAGCLDFSRVVVGERKVQPLMIHSFGDRPVRIQRMSLPLESRQHFSVLAATPLTLGPGADPVEVLVEFHPSWTGPHEARIEISTDEGQDEPVKIGVCATGAGRNVPAISCDTEIVDFGMVAVGLPERRHFQCTNTGTPMPGAETDLLVVRGVRSTAPAFSARIFHPISQVEGPRPGGYRIGEGFTVEVLYAPVGERSDAAAIQLETASAPDGRHEVPVIGQGRDLPPCDFTILPPVAHFGFVAPGQTATQTVGIRNDGETSCLIMGLRISSDVAGAFSVEAEEQLELRGHEILLVPVKFSPRVIMGLYKAFLEFEISNPNQMNQRVALRGTSIRPCLEIEPPALDFGKIAPGCRSREIQVIVANTCETPATILSLGMTDEVGAEAFLLRRQPPLPHTLRTGERAEFALSFRPSEVGDYEGRIELEVEGAEPPITKVSGEAVETPIQVDTFDPRTRTKVDVLWVMENSTLISPFQDRIATGASALLEAANDLDVDFHLAVTTTGLTSYSSSCPGGARGGEDGRFFPIDGTRPRILTPTTPNFEETFARNLRVGTCHSLPFHAEAAFRALSKPLIYEARSSMHESGYNDGNAGFLRPDAALSIVFVSPYAERSTHFGRSLEDYLAFFRGLKDPGMLRIHAISGEGAGMPSPCGLRYGDRFHHLVEATDGTWISICSLAPGEHFEWGEMLAEGVFEFGTRFGLRGTPGDRNGDGIVDERDIELRLGKEDFASSGPGVHRRWRYAPIANAIDFEPMYDPRFGVDLTATYEVACHEP